MKTALLIICFTLVGVYSNAQYIGVRARYTQTRLVNDNPTMPPSRENRLVLAFYSVSPTGNWAPTSLSNQTVWIQREGFQYGNEMGGVLDSTGNNYPGYTYCAPKVVAYYNSYNPTYIDCSPLETTSYVVNGHQLDCGFIRVSHWEEMPSGEVLELFTAPNICLPYYFPPDPYAFEPGNVNFTFPLFPTAAYNWYNFTCNNSPQQLVIRGLLLHDSSEFIEPLPVRFADVHAEWDNPKVKISWSNLTESDILFYTIEQSVDAVNWHTIDTASQPLNHGERADYSRLASQNEQKAFYRVKASEVSGTDYYSSVLVVSKPVVFNPAANFVTIYPNPCPQGKFIIRMKGADAGRYIFSVIGPDGRHLKQKMISYDGGEWSRIIDITDVPRGIYQVVLQSSTSRYTQKLMYVH